MNIRGFVTKISDSANSFPSETFKSPGKIYTCVNPYSYHIFRNNKSLYDRFDGLFVDGITMCWWIRLLWDLKVPRLSFDMSSMARILFSHLEKNPDQTIYFIGSKEETIKKTIHVFKENYPSMNITGARSGFFLNDSDRSVAIKGIVQLNPSFTIIGMGSPLQEKFARDLKDYGYKGIAFTCGGFLHQTSEEINYYPAWINKYNLRAFYRLYKEKGLWLRLYNVLIQFPILFTYDTIDTKLHRTK